MISIAVLILLPLLGAFLSFAAPRVSRVTTLVVAISVASAALLLALQVNSDGPLRILVGGWDTPLGIALYVDGLAALMLCLSAVVGSVTSLYALNYFQHDNKQAARMWWPLWLLLWSALNALFLTADIFNLYVTLELMGLTAVALVALEAKAMTAAIRYLLVGLLGSMLYLLGVGLVYSRFGTVDMSALADVMQTEPAAWLGMALMSGGLMLKAALFPLHFWLPPAHSNAPAPVSAVLSALVVKASFYTMVRLWFGPFEALVTPMAGLILALLGSGAIVWGSLQALLAPRLKLVIAYSTIAQLGYMFLLFAFIGIEKASTIAWYGAIWLALSHGLAKAALFLAAGNIIHATGHDRVTNLAGAGQHLPVTLFAIGAASISLMGLPPSGGFVGKWLLLNAAFVSGQWWWALVLLFGGVMTAAYSFRVLLHAFRNSDTNTRSEKPPAIMEWSALGLALCAILMGLWSAQPLALLEIGASLGPLSLTQVTP